MEGLHFEADLSEFTQGKQRWNKVIRAVGIASVHKYEKEQRL